MYLYIHHTHCYYYYSKETARLEIELALKISLLCRHKQILVGQFQMFCSTVII